jgi:Protein of unknown function (DUF3105)
MSMSTSHGGGGSRRPPSTKPGGKPKDAPVGGSPAKKTGATGSAAKKAGAPAKKAGGGKGKKPITPVKVNAGRPWGAILLFAAVGAIALGIIGFGAFAVFQNSKSWEDRAAAISGIKNYRKSDPKMLKYEKHEYGSLKYTVAPPVGGTHNPNWQRCQGDVYNAPIASEHAVHSMEHGAVWITYQPDLAKSEVDKLAKKVKGHDYMLMSPFPGLDKKISVQTWGYQLKVDSASDKRIDEFVSALREKSAPEQGATCTAGSYITETGTTPRDLQPPPDQQQQQGGQPGVPTTP